MRQVKFCVWWVVLSILAIIFFLWMGARAEAALSDCIDATCRVTASDGGCGTGCVFAIADGRVYVLTNAHVATGQTVQLEFWREGHQSRPLSGQIIMRDQQADAAVVIVEAAAFGGQLPTAVPIARTGDPLRSGETITSVGCANGSWSTGWKGHVLQYRDGDLLFRPTPADGRSGSAIFDADGTRIIGLLRARREEGQRSYGVATSVDTLWRHIGEHNAKCPPGRTCPDPRFGGGKSGPQGTPWRLLPYRHQQDERDRAQDERIDKLYPTMPEPQQQVAPMVDVVPPPVQSDATPAPFDYDHLATLVYLKIKADAARFRGPVGATGPTGLTGQTGEQGAPGIAGQAGKGDHQPAVIDIDRIAQLVKRKIQGSIIVKIEPIP